MYAVGAAKCPNCGSTERTDGRGGSVLPSLTVACANSGCRYVGRERRVYLRTAAPGVLEMPRLVCVGCGLDMPTLTPWPPVNDSEDTTMPKITRHGGATNAAANAEDVPGAPPAVESGEGEQPSAGSSSETSTGSRPQSSEPSVPATRKRARTTGNRSGRARTGSSSARSTDGGPEDGTSETTSAGDEAAE